MFNILPTTIVVPAIGRLTIAHYPPWPKFCSECGTKINAEWKHCAACGKQILSPPPIIPPVELQWEYTGDKRKRFRIPCPCPKCSPRR